MKRLMIYLSVLFNVFVLSQIPALADNDILKGIASASKGTGYKYERISTIVGRVISALLALIGVVFIVVIIYAGIMYLTSGGAEEKVKTAKKMMTQAIIGIILIVGAYAITDFVLGQLNSV